MENYRYPDSREIRDLELAARRARAEAIAEVIVSAAGALKRFALGAARALAGHRRPATPAKRPA